MQVIPVLDLLDGHAVHAVRGERSQYQPVRSTLCADSEPLTVARALMSATHSRVLYVADLNAITRRGDHASVLSALCEALGEGASLWLDAGFFDFASMLDCLARIDAGAGSARVVPVFGSETLRDVHAIAQACDAGFEPVLSLDYRFGSLLGSVDASFWPSRVIVMTLDQVGASGGPDLSTFADVLAAGAGAGAAARDVRVFGAGGVRSPDDLHRALRCGASGWLVASALHQGVDFHLHDSNG